jgi:hypothetical protein
MLPVHQLACAGGGGKILRRQLGARHEAEEEEEEDEEEKEGREGFRRTAFRCFRWATNQSAPGHIVGRDALCTPRGSQQLCSLEAKRADVGLQRLFAKLRAKLKGSRKGQVRSVILSASVLNEQRVSGHSITGELDKSSKTRCKPTCLEARP